MLTPIACCRQFHLEVLKTLGSAHSGVQFVALDMASLNARPPQVQSCNLWQAMLDLASFTLLFSLNHAIHSSLWLRLLYWQHYDITSQISRLPWISVWSNHIGTELCSVSAPQLCITDQTSHSQTTLIASQSKLDQPVSRSGRSGESVQTPFSDIRLWGLRWRSFQMMCTNYMHISFRQIELVSPV